MDQDVPPVTLKLNVNEIFFIKLSTLWMIIILFLAIVFISFVGGVAYCVYALRRSRRSMLMNGFFDNNLDHF